MCGLMNEAMVRLLKDQPKIWRSLVLVQLAVVFSFTPMSLPCVVLQLVLHNIIFHIESLVPVRFTQATYNVSEGVNANTVITVESIRNHDFPFTVFVVTRDGSARGECQEFMDNPFSISLHIM